jgi:hypothetical protein
MEVGMMRAPVALAVLSFAACGSTKVMVTQPLPATLAKYREIVIKFPYVFGDPVTEVEKAVLTHRMVERLQRSGKFAKVTSFEQTGQEFGDLKIQLAFRDVNRLDGAQVYFREPGAGASAVLEVALVDIASGKRIGAIAVAAQAPGATVFSGWTMNALENATYAAVDYLLSKI